MTTNRVAFVAEYEDGRTVEFSNRPLDPEPRRICGEDHSP
jgi:hypothetical protein